MAAKVQFDPDNRLIIVVEEPVGGRVTLDVQADLYSDGKEDWLTDETLSRLRFPFRTIGGDPLGGELSAGAYFFLQNQNGWRIRPYEMHHELTLVGNLFAEDPDAPIFVPTLGDYTVSVRLMTSSLAQQLLGGDPEDIWSYAARTLTDKTDFALTATEHNAIADALLKRDWSLVAGEATRSVLNALRFLRNAWGVVGATLTVTKEDDVTPAWTADVTADGAAKPVTRIDPT